MMALRHAWKGAIFSLVLLAIAAWPIQAAESRGVMTADETAAARQRLAELNKRDYLSELFRTVSDLIKPAVVEIRVVKWGQRPEMPEMEDFLRRFFEEEELPFEFHYRTPAPREGFSPKVKEFLVRGLGSGVIVDATNGYVLTNYHVVAGADQVKVVLADGRQFTAEWIRSDPLTDLTILKIEAEDLVEAPLGDSDAVAVGDWVLAVGAPQRLPETVTAGIVSAKSRVTNGGPMYQNYIQTDAAIHRGNSGGPLVNMRGEIIGINDAIISSTGYNEGIGFAIPSNMAKKVMSELIEKGKVTRGYLGVYIQDITSDALAESLGLPDPRGALVVEVRSDTPAEQAGLKTSDVIVSVNGQAIADTNELRHVVADIDPGSTVELAYYRDGQKHTVDVTIAPQPKEIAWAMGRPGRAEEPAAETAADRFGLTVTTLDEDRARQAGYRTAPQGVLITDVARGSDALEQGLQPGMVILDAQGKPVQTAEEFNQAIAGEDAAKGIRLRVMDPTGAKRILFIRPMEEAK